MQTTVPDAKARLAVWLGVLLLLLCASWLFSANNGFSIHYHSDEAKKVHFTAAFEQDFKHPLLLLQTSRLIRQVVGAEEPLEIARIGRSVSAAAAVGLVLTVFVIARPRIGAAAAFAAAGGVALSPVVVVHAHYFKEDLLLTFACMLALLALARFIERPALGGAVALGVATGLAFSSHYKSLVLVLVYILSIGLVAPERRRLFILLGAGTAAVAAMTFLSINYPALWDLDGFTKGLFFEGDHALSGHDLVIRPVEHLFSFHLTHSLIPGMTLPLALAAVAATALAALRFRRLDTLERVLLLFTVIAYLVVELSPTKPFPDFQRYVLPAVPGLIYFFVKALVEAVAAVPTRRALIVGLATLVLLLYPAYVSVNLIANLDRDTRDRLAALVEARPGDYSFEWYTLAGASSVRDIADLDIEKLAIGQPVPEPVDAESPGVADQFYVASSFMYERFFAGLTMADQRPQVYEKASRYAWLFSRFACMEIRPRYRAFAFSNPVLRIVDLSRPTAHASNCIVVDATDAMN